MCLLCANCAPLPTLPLPLYSVPSLRLPLQLQSPHNSPQEVTAFSAYRNTNSPCHPVTQQTKCVGCSRCIIHAVTDTRGGTCTQTCLYLGNSSTGWEAVVIVLACPASQNQYWEYIYTAALLHSMPLWSHTSLLLPPLTESLPNLVQLNMGSREGPRGSRGSPYRLPRQRASLNQLAV